MRVTTNSARRPSLVEKDCSLLSSKVSIAAESHSLRTTPTLRISRDKHPVFIEIRARSHNPKEITARLEDTWLRGRRSSVGGLQLFADSFVTASLTKDGTLWVRKAESPNLATPYLLIQRSPSDGETVVMATRSASVVTTTPLLRSFITEVDTIAQQYPDNIVYSLSALTALHSFFYALAEAEEIPLETAALMDEKYEKIHARLLGGSTYHERRVAYSKCYSLLARTCGLRSTTTTNFTGDLTNGK